MRQLTLSGAMYSTESNALAAVQHLTLKVNGSEAFVQKQQATMGKLVERFIESERHREVKAVRPGETAIEGAVQYGTAASYLTSLERYIEPRWEHAALVDVKPAVVDEWLRGLRKLPPPSEVSLKERPLLSAKTRGNIKQISYRLLEKAMFWKLVPLARIRSV